MTLAAAAVLGGIMVSWSYPGTNPHAVVYTQVFGGPTSNFANAVQLGNAAGDRFLDARDNSTQYWYWIKQVSINGTVGPLVGPATAIAQPLASQLLEQLTGKIDSSKLASALQTTLGEISIVKADLLAEITAREDGSVSLADAIAAADAKSQQALTFIDQEIASRTTADSAVAESINTVASTLNGNIAAAQTTLQTQINTTNGKVTDIGALYTAKVTVNGLVGGFGIYNDGTQVDAGFDVDTFWVGKTGANKRKPFIIVGGVTYIDSAVIASLTADKIAAGSIATGQYIQSSNYVAGVSGYRISSTTFEFNSGGTFRGTIDVASASSGARLQITNQVIKVFDAGGVVRVKLGNLDA